jgi:hypothetical protein
MHTGGIRHHCGTNAGAWFTRHLSKRVRVAGVGILLTPHPGRLAASDASTCTLLKTAALLTSLWYRSDGD